MDRLRLIGRSEEIAIVVSSINSVAPLDRPLQILEAGCGQKWDLDLDLKYVLTGVDLDPAALKIRMETQKDLHHGIVGDLISVQLPENSFDVVYSYYVLEHIAAAQSALLNIVKWLRPGGIAIIKVPDPNSVHGFFARITPHWFHILFYRHVLGNQRAGTPGNGPYTTYYAPVISRSGMRKFCADNSVSLAEFGDASQFIATRLTHRLVHLFKKVVGILAFGRLSTEHEDLLYVVQKG
jgi:SAM-dependent methyltransferase